MRLLIGKHMWAPAAHLRRRAAERRGHVDAVLAAAGGGQQERVEEEIAELALELGRVAGAQFHLDLGELTARVLDELRRGAAARPPAAGGATVGRVSRGRSRKRGVAGQGALLTHGQCVITPSTTSCRSADAALISRARLRLAREDDILEKSPPGVNLEIERSE